MTSQTSTVDELNKNDGFSSKSDISWKMRVMQLRRDVISWIFSEFAENDQEATEENSILACSWNFLRGCNCSL